MCTAETKQYRNDDNFLTVITENTFKKIPLGF